VSVAAIQLWVLVVFPLSFWMGVSYLVKAVLS